MIFGETGGEYEERLEQRLPKQLYDVCMQSQSQRDWSGCSIIQYDPRKLGGAPTVRGRRITPDSFVGSYNADKQYTPEYIAKELFEEPVEDVREVLRYAEKKGWLVRPLP